MNQLSEETANKLADAFKDVKDSMSGLSQSYSNNFLLIAINLKRQMMFDYLREIESYFKFDRKYPFNRIAFLLLKKWSLNKIKQLNRDIKKLNNTSSNYGF